MRALAIALLLAGSWSARAASDSLPPLPVYDQIAGAERDYVVQPGDMVWSITGRFTMTRALLDALNTLPDPDHLRPGMHLRVSDRHIVPRRGSDDIVIDLATRTLYWFRRGALHAHFPVGIGRLDWATPIGRYRIVGRREDPVWHVPDSIQAEMRARGERVVARVEPGPENPLGKYLLRLSVPGYALHGTNAPGSVGKYATHGCLRLRNEDVERLYRDAPDGTRVDVIYEPVKVARDGDAVFLEVHRDVRGTGAADLGAVLALLANARLADAVDAERVAAVTARAWGTPEDVSRAVAPPALVPASGQ
ncbi:MAG TPA: L,D-transpeptidase family protein [Candidatus Binatia bacterium]|nr:L,D-transpeptidase family protein [Candidatus Binatia bacterium]